MIKQSKEHDDWVTIVGGEYEDHEEVWKECLSSASKFRYFAPKDTIINWENKTYVSREILASKEGGDLRTRLHISSSRNENMPLAAKSRVDVDRPYIFPKLGDEIPGIGYPELHCTFRGVRDWDTVVKKANFAACDRNVDIEVTADDVEKRRKIVYDIEKDEVMEFETKPGLGILISCADLKPVFDNCVFHSFQEEASKVHMSPPSKRGRMSDGKARPRIISRTVGLKLIGMGPEVTEHGLRAALNINLVLKF